MLARISAMKASPNACPALPGLDRLPFAVRLKFCLDGGDSGRRGRYAGGVEDIAELLRDGVVGAGRLLELLGYFAQRAFLHQPRNGRVRYGRV